MSFNFLLKYNPILSDRSSRVVVHCGGRIRELKEVELGLKQPIQLLLPVAEQSDKRNKKEVVD